MYYSDAKPHSFSDNTFIDNNGTYAANITTGPMYVQTTQRPTPKAGTLEHPPAGIPKGLWLGNFSIRAELYPQFGLVVADSFGQTTRPYELALVPPGDRAKVQAEVKELLEVGIDVRFYNQFLLNHTLYFQVAEGALFSLHHLHNSRSLYSIPESLYPSLLWKHQLQEAKLYWGRGESSLALGQLRGLLQRMKTLSMVCSLL